jgi:hypothetical protein
VVLRFLGLVISFIGAFTLILVMMMDILDISAGAKLAYGGTGAITWLFFQALLKSPYCPGNHWHFCRKKIPQRFLQPYAGYFF